MRIILLTSKIDLETAGGSVIDLDFKARGLVELGHDVTVITTFIERNKIPINLPYHVTEEMIAKRSLLPLQYYGYRILKKYEAQCDAFYIDGQIFVYAGGAYKYLGGNIPIISFFNVRLNCWGDTHRTAEIGAPNIFKKLKKKIRIIVERIIGIPIANSIDAHIFTTPMVAQLYNEWGFKKEKSYIIPDFVDMRALTKKHHISKAQIFKKQHDAKKLVIFSTGRMIPEKGFDLLIEAFALVEEKDKYHVILCGGGPDKERLEILVKEKGLRDYFTFTGWVDRCELENFLTDAHIFVFPRWWIEYTSVLLIEVFAFGLPCIIPANGGLAWLANDKALMFPENNYIDMAKCIEKLGRDEELRISIGEELLNRTDELDKKILLQKLENIFIEVTTR